MNEVNEVITEATANGQHIHVHIHMDGVKSTQNETSKDTSNKGGYLTAILWLIIACLGLIAGNKYGLLDKIPVNIANLNLDLNPFPKTTLSLPAPAALQPVAMRCVALNVGIDLNGQPVPASDANVNSIPTQVCYNGCTYEVIASQAWIGIDGGQMRYTGKFRPIGQSCMQGQDSQNDGTQEAVLTVIPLYMLREYLLGGEKPDDKTETAPLPTLKVPFIDEKIEEAKTKIKDWLWSASRFIILVVAGIVLLIGFFFNRLSRIILILVSLSAIYYTW